MALSSYVHSILNWVRAGYPEGLPPKDYLPLFALLGTHVTNDDMHAIADELAKSSDPDSAAAMKKAITDVMDVKPTDADIARVRARLAQGGWPLAKPDEFPADAVSAGQTS
jgi:predicted transcriptional regulator